MVELFLVISKKTLTSYIQKCRILMLLWNDVITNCRDDINPEYD